MASPRQPRKLANLALVQEHTTIHVEAPGDGKRADHVVRQRLPWLTARALHGLFENDRVRRNGIPVPPGRKVNLGDVITIKHPEPWEDLTEMDLIRWDTLYEDERILVINKPPHLVVHPAGGYRYTTLLNALHKKYVGDRDDLTDDDRVPRLVHRIDKETSGVLVIAFDREAHGSLGTLFQDRSELVEKEYIALVEGRVEWDEQDITLPIGIPPNDPIRLRRAIVADGQPARTLVRVLERFPHFSLVRCKLFTGRQHQIRVHMQAVGHPLVGDHLYGVRDELRELDIADPTTPPVRIDGVYLDETVPDVEAAGRIREVDLIKRREYWAIEAGERIDRPGAGRLLLSRCALHCALMAFPHPDDGRSIRVEAPLTPDMELALAALRAARS